MLNYETLSLEHLVNGIIIISIIEIIFLLVILKTLDKIIKNQFFF
jgi:hypothetical protein